MRVRTALTAAIAADHARQAGNLTRWQNLFTPHPACARRLQQLRDQLALRERSASNRKTLDAAERR